MLTIVSLFASVAVGESSRRFATETFESHSLSQAEALVVMTDQLDVLSIMPLYVMMVFAWMKTIDELKFSLSE